MQERTKRRGTRRGETNYGHDRKLHKIPEADEFKRQGLHADKHMQQAGRVLFSAPKKKRLASKVTMRLLNQLPTLIV